MHVHVINRKGLFFVFCFLFSHEKKAESIASAFIFINRERDINKVDRIKERKMRIKNRYVIQLAVSHCISLYISVSIAPCILSGVN